jgi:hypothetical protein
MTNKLRVFLIPVLTILFVAGNSYNAFALLDLKSEGKYALSKGTKADALYEERQGAPVYEYGKGLHLGPVHLKPSIDYNWEYDTNIFMEENGRQSDVINRLMPDLRAELPLNGGQHLLHAGYRAVVEWFERHGDQDHDDHTGTLGADLNFVPFTLSVEDTLTRTVDRADTEFTTRVQRDENTFRGLLEVPFSMFFLESEVYDFDVSYDNVLNQVFDHHEFNFYQRAGYDWTPSTQLMVEYGYKNLSYNNNDTRDGDANQFAFGARGHLTELVTYQAWLGAQYRIYDEDARPDYNGLIARAALRWDMSEQSRLELRGDIAPQESTFDGQSFYVRHRIEGELRRQLAERIFLNARAGVDYNEYSRITVRDNTERTRRDYQYFTAAGLEYLMPNDLVSFFGEYMFQARDSNTALLDYDDQKVTGGVRARF